MKLNELVEAAENNEIEFVDSNPESELPALIIKKLERKVKDGAKDYETEWDGAVSLLNWAFESINITIPTLNNTARWKQYKQMISLAVKELIHARGIDYIKSTPTIGENDEL